MSVIWLVGPAPEGSGMATLRAALNAAGARVEHLREGAAAQWRSSVEQGLEPAELPHLIVLDGALARSDMDAWITQIKQNQPWGMIPMVIADEDDSSPDLYALGVSSCVVIPRGEAGQRSATVFAHYWTQTIILPEGLSARVS